MQMEYKAVASGVGLKKSPTDMVFMFDTCSVGWHEKQWARRLSWKYGLHKKWE